ncbi:MAG: hypothetical protein ACTSXJ_10080 [Candidatus Baldrarchaeia archaeon]
MRENIRCVERFRRIFAPVKCANGGIYSLREDAILMPHKEVVALLKRGGIRFVGRGESARVKIDGKEYVVLLRDGLAVGYDLVRRAEKVLGRNIFWVLGHGNRVAISNGEYAIVLRAVPINVIDAWL